MRDPEVLANPRQVRLCMQVKDKFGDSDVVLVIGRWLSTVERRCHELEEPTVSGWAGPAELGRRRRHLSPKIADGSFANRLTGGT